jgi:hypothetical protein
MLDDVVLEIAVAVALLSAHGVEHPDFRETDLQES